MALSKTNIIRNYLQKNNLLAAPEAADLYRQIYAFYDAMEKSHLMKWDWDFAETADVDLTDTVPNGYMVVSTSNILIIKSARVATSGLVTPNQLRPITKGELDIYMIEDETANTNPEYLAKFQERIYPYPPSAVDTIIKISGILDPDGGGTITIPDKHEEAFFRYIDYKLGKSDYDVYLEEIKALGGAELRDFWGDVYGANQTSHN